MIEFYSCCFCIPQRQCCLILGYLHLVASIALTIVSSLELATVIKWMARRVGIEKDAANVVIASTVISLLLALVLLTISILLVVGLHKEKKKYVKTYLVYYVIFIILSAIVYIVRIATRPIALAYNPGYLIQILLMYFMLVIRSLWFTMRENNENNFNTAYSARRSAEN